MCSKSMAYRAEFTQAVYARPRIWPRVASQTETIIIMVIKYSRGWLIGLATLRNDTAEKNNEVANRTK